MTNAANPFLISLASDDAVNKLVREALELPAEQTNPTLNGLVTGTDSFEDEVHVIASPWIDDGFGSRASGLCGAELVNLAYGLFSARPMCWLCNETLEAKRPC